MSSTNRNTVARAVKAIAADTKNIILTNHARDRMRERSITRIEINRCLQHGQQRGDGVQDEQGNWKVEMLHTVAGRRLIVQAVVQEEGGSKVIVVTAWRLR